VLCVVGAGTAYGAVVVGATAATAFGAVGVGATTADVVGGVGGVNMYHILACSS